VHIADCPPLALALAVLSTMSPFSLIFPAFFGFLLALLLQVLTDDLATGMVAELS
jgi:hypothetical protein